jgi:hypothetical protein
MKNFYQTLVVIAFAATLGAAPNAQAVNLALSAGYWPSTWNLSAFPVLIHEWWGYGSTQGEDHWENASSLDTSGAGLYGLNGMISFNNPFGIGVTFLTSTYEFSIDQQFTEQYGDITAVTDYKLDFDVDRTDLDVALTYRLGNHFVVNVGYKSLTYSYGTQHMELVQSQHTPYGELGTASTPQELPAYEVTYQGFGPGTSASFPIGQQGFLAFGAVSFLPYFVASESGKQERLADDSGWAVNSEVGIAFVPKTLPLFGRLSYRYQRFDGFSVADVDKDENQDFQGIQLQFGVRI